jgi:predicted lipoprotein with Yx(FWY)xxD motif
MFTRSRIAALAVAPAACLVLLSACTQAATPAAPATTAASSAPASSAPASSAPASSAPAPTPADAATLALGTADTGLGTILVDGKGMTLYMFTKDAQNSNKSACTGQCLVAWPPLYGKPTAGKGADDSKLGSFALPDGTLQASYNGWPLYYWKDDAKAGDTLGQKVGGVWFVLGKDGEPIKK